MKKPKVERRLLQVLERVNRKKTFVTFAEEILEQHTILKRHFVLKFHDDYYGDCYDFDFRKELKGTLSKKFELLIHILDFDEAEQTETLLKELNWFLVYPSGFNIDQLIEEASFGRSLSRVHDIGAFHNFQHREWENFVRYFFGA